MKLTKKQLKELSKELNALYFTGNVYHYETIISYIQSKSIDRLKYFEKNDIKELMEIIKKYNGCCFVASQLAYSCGVYGNTGQLHKIDIYNNYKDNDIIYTFYTFY